MKQKDYDACFDVLSTAEKRNVSSDYIKSVKMNSHIHLNLISIHTTMLEYSVTVFVQ